MVENVQQRLIGALLLLVAIIAVAIFLVKNANDSAKQQVETIQPDFVSSVDTMPTAIQSSEPEVKLDPHQLDTMPKLEQLKEPVQAAVTPQIEAIPQQVAKTEAIIEQKKTTVAKVVEEKAVEPATQWLIQLGSFSKQDNAKSLQDKVKKMGLQAHIEPISRDNITNYRVRIGPESNRKTVDNIVAKISKTLSLKPQVITVKEEI